MYRHKGVTYIETEEDVLEIQEMDILLTFTSAKAVASFFKIQSDLAVKIMDHLERTGRLITETNIEFGLKEAGIV
jgi:hypothetical protein